MPSIGAVMMVWLEVHLGLVERGLGLRDLRFAPTSAPPPPAFAAVAAVSRSLRGDELLLPELLGAPQLHLRVVDVDRARSTSA